MIQDVKLDVGKQNFEDGTVSVTVNDKVENFPMFQDEDGDYGFYYGTEEIYFTHLKYESSYLNNK
jgi:hypothetical protein